MRFARREGISDIALCKAVSRTGQGHIDADLGGGVIKQRIARPGQSRSRGYRAIVLFRSGERSIFVHGYAKSGQDNIGKDELNAFRLLAETMLAMDEDSLRAAISNGTIIEVMCDDETIQERRSGGSSRNGARSGGSGSHAETDDEDFR